MKPNILFLAELYVGKCKIAYQLPNKISLSFRIGKNMVQSTQTRIAKDGEIDIDTTLQLNTDQLALQTQRSSLTLSSIAPNGQITVIGMALIPLSKEVTTLSKKFKLTQCPDKNAEVEINLNVSPLDSLISPPQGNNFAMTLRSSGVSSSRSIMEMQDFDRKVISPPRLFNVTEKDNKLMPPKPKSAKEIPSHAQDLKESVSKLQSECQCLKELLKVEIKKSDASNKLIDSLVSALEEVNSSSRSLSHNDLDETLLLEGIDKDDTIDKICQRNAELEKEVATLHSIIEQLKIQNKHLLKTNESTRISSREALNSLKEIAPRQEIIGENNKKIDKLTSEVAQLEVELIQKIQQIQRFKRKMKMNVKIPALESPQFQKQSNQMVNIKQAIDRIIHDNRELMKAILRFIKHEADIQSDGFLGKIRQKIDRTFGSLIAKKMNRDIILFEKGQLVKGIEDLWQKCT